MAYHRADGISLYEQRKAQSRYHIGDMEFFYEVGDRRCIYGRTDVDRETTRDPIISTERPHFHHDDKVRTLTKRFRTSQKIALRKTSSGGFPNHRPHTNLPTETLWC